MGAPTIKDVARLAGVSIYTVSKYINGGTLKPANQEAVRKAIEELHYKPNAIAQSLRTAYSMTVGVVVPSIRNQFDAELIVNIERALAEYGYAHILCDCGNDPAMQEERFRFLLNKRVDAIITVPMAGEGEHIALAQRAGVPVIVVGNTFPNVQCDAVIGDDRSVVYDAVKYLISLGHVDIAFLGGDSQLQVSQERQMGYMDGLIEANLPVYEPFLRNDILTVRDGYDAMLALWTHGRVPTAVVATTHEAAMGVNYAVGKRRIFVPDELSVIGFNCAGVNEYMSPTLDCIEQPVAKMGEMAARLALLRIGGDQSGFPRTVTVQNALNGGQSVGRRLVNWKTTTRFRAITNP